MSDLTWPVQQAVCAALLASADVVDRVADTPDGPAVFARRGRYSDRLPRVTLEPPQVLRRGGGCVVGSEVFVTVHSWASGDAATRDAGLLADAVRAALDVKLALAGHRILSGDAFQSSTPAGDPDESVEHIVSVFRYLTQPV